MSQLAVGIIETIGLAACIEAADACVKSANVNLIGYELSKGGGMAVLKVEGDVGAVKAAVDAGIVAANKVNKVFSYKVIPRPSDQIEDLIRSNDTVGYIKESIDIIEETVSEQIEINEEKEIVESTEGFDDNKVSEVLEETKEIEVTEEINVVEDSVEYVKLDNSTEEGNYTCNICKDPKCSRQKGELKTNCIHYNELNDN